MEDSTNPYQTDELIFAQEDEDIQSTAEVKAIASQANWKILIVDDEVDVHQITQLALRDVVFEQKPLTFISAYTAEAAKQLVQAHPDIAIIFLDVVMETEDAGLQLINYIREELENPIVRIILRTGQPGRAPEQVVALNYGIDDYKTKTELTAQKLLITVITALRAFSTLRKMLTMVKPEPAIAPAPSATRQIDVTAMRQLIMSVANEIDRPIAASDDSYTMSAITRIAKMVLRTTEDHFNKLGISQSKLETLSYLSHALNQSASPSALAKHCGVSRAAMTGLLDGLEQEGYVERDTHPSDRRALMVKLTPKGQQFLDWAIPQDHYQLSELINALDATERKKLIELAAKAMELGEEG
jgi:DNA-binding MarR family transcriptional regulator/CheY-like chemotaxis protein